MNSLIDAIAQFGKPTQDLIGALVGILLPWTPLAAWIAFWTFGVNWVKLRETLSRGGWVGLVLIGVVMVLVWGTIVPGYGSFDFFGLKVSPFVEKTVFVSGLYCIMFLAGALQLSGCCASCCQFDEPLQIADTHGHDAQDDHGGHADSHDSEAHH